MEILIDFINSIAMEQDSFIVIVLICLVISSVHVNLIIIYCT